MGSREFWKELREWLTVVAVAGAAGVGLFTWRLSVHQARTASVDAFRLDAAQIVMQEPTCKKIVNREIVLQRLFPKQLGDYFGGPLGPLIASATCSSLNQPLTPAQKKKLGELLNSGRRHTATPYVPPFQFFPPRTTPK